MSVLGESYIEAKQAAFERQRSRGDRLELDKQRFEDASRLKSQFLANMSHELRTPLNAINGFAEILHDGLVSPDSPRYAEFTQAILASGQHLLKLINDVLDLSKVDAGQLDFHPRPVRVTELVDEVLGVLSLWASERGLSIATSVDPDVDEVVLDGSRFKQVLYNYLANALKFTPGEGEILVRVVAEGASYFRLEVEDPGVGIASEDIPHLFSEFHQLDAGSTKRHGGTGLGLALTRRLVEAQGGTVGVHSEPGVGSVFYAVLPRISRIRRSLPARRVVPGASPSAPAILVVEDDPRDLDFIVAILVGEGYEIETASTAAQALELARRRRFDAVTLDILLPDGSGLDVLRELRGQPHYEAVPVIVTSVVADDNLGAGFAVQDVLRKPLERERLVEALSRAGVTNQRTTPNYVLVVDDDPNALLAMRVHLDQVGLQGNYHAGAESGLVAVRDAIPTVVVLDLMMPGVDGFEFLRRFRAVPGCESVPVLVWTAMDLSAEDLETLQSNAQAVVRKGRGTGGEIISQLKALWSETGGLHR